LLLFIVVYILVFASLSHVADAPFNNYFKVSLYINLYF
jgi:hypothetical protein